MKKLLCLLLCAALLCSMTSCVNQPSWIPQPPADDPVTDTPQVPEEPVEPELPEEPDEPEVPQEPQEPEKPTPPEEPDAPELVLTSPAELSFEDDTFLQPGPEETVLVVSRQIVDTETMPYRTALLVTVYDPISREILAQADLGEDAYILPQLFADKSFAVVSEDGTRYDFYDKHLQYVHTYRRPVDAQGYFSNDKRCFYYADGVLKRYIMASGATEEISVAGGLPVRIVMGIHPQRDELTVMAETDPFGLSAATAVLDVKSGELEWFSADYTSTAQFAEGTVYYLYEDEGYRSVYVPENGEAYYEVTLPMNALQSFQPVSCGPLLMTRMADAEQSVRLYRFSPVPSYADLSVFSILHDPMSMLYDPGSNCMFYSVRQSEDTPCRVVILDLDRLDFTPDAPAMQLQKEHYIDSERIAHYFEIEDPVLLRGGLEYLRSYADELQERFDVQILFSGACAEPCADGDFAVQTTDSLSLRYESQMVYGALTKIEETLASYPEGFFSEFKDENTLGVRILLVSTIDSSFGVVAYEFFAGGWFNIVYDVNYQSTVTANLNHELWHAIEEKLNFIDGVWVDEILWAGFNPEGFAYSEEYETHYDNSSEFVYYTEFEPERVYFIDTYSKTFAKEDRARIMEYAMSYDYFMQRLQYSPAIMQKLGYLSVLLRENFDSASWQQAPLWEAYLSESTE